MGTYEERVEHGMFVRERAVAGAPRLLWIHGLGESGLCFEAIAAHPALAGTAALILDLPGYGRSERPATPLTLAATADRVADWLKSRRAAPVIAVGHSMGGVLGVLLAERHPDIVDGLVDVDGNVSLGDCTYSARAAAFDAAGFAARGFAEMCAYVDDRATTDRAHQGYARSIRLADPATFHLHARELVATSEAETMGRRLSRLLVPVTYVAGSPGGACARSIELLDAARIRRVDVAPAGHWPFVDRPDELAAAVAAAL